MAAEYPDLAAFLATLTYNKGPVPVYSSIMGTNGKVSGSVPIGYMDGENPPTAGDTVFPVYGALPPATDFVNGVALDKVVCAYVPTTPGANPGDKPIVKEIVLRFRQYSDVMFGAIPPDAP